MFDRLQARIGRAIAHYLGKELPGYRPYPYMSFDRFAPALAPCDVVLVEGTTRISTAIKYLTNSTWSHAAFYAGDDRPGEELIEADLEHGVRTVALETYANANTRICRPVGLTDTDRQKVIDTMRAAIGRSYDIRNVIDLARYLLPQPPVPARFRRRLLALGSGDPTRAICSTLIAEAFQSVRYPILPEVRSDCLAGCAEDLLHIRHHSLFVPRDFDLSPFFRIVKPLIDEDFDYRALNWDDPVVP